MLWTTLSDNAYIRIPCFLLKKGTSSQRSYGKRKLST